MVGVAKIRVERSIRFHFDTEIEGSLTTSTWHAYAHVGIGDALAELDLTDTQIDSVVTRVFEEFDPEE